ncbi:MAG TPA: Tol-Pal system protein TolB [Rhabdochlamydiaceae bacterium]|nr:Tol-Pal system protein TolB [Rhabdochlamydiaceae bacterium]
MIPKLLSILLLFLGWQLNAEENEIRVHLHTQEALAPLYLGRIQDASSPLNADYLKKLSEILHFDLNHNGFTKVAAPREDLEKALEEKNPHLAFKHEFWDKSKMAFVVKPFLVQSQFHCYVYSSRKGSLKQFKDIILTGDLSQDRRLLHRLADSIQKELFNVMGVAGTRILYSKQKSRSAGEKSSWQSEIWECDFDGGNEKQVTHEGSYSITPVLLPPHPYFGKDRFIYVSYKIGQPKIYQSSVKERTGKRIIDLRGNQLLPAISPKRDKIAFICDASGKADLFVQQINAEGQLIDKPMQLYSSPKATQASPTFSPDGSKVAFVSDQNGSPRIYIIPATPGLHRSEPVMITKQNRENICPAWSPDGTKLAFSAKTKDIRQIWIYDFETKEETQLTFGPGNKENPCWAPDSLHIVFNSTDPNSSELYIVNLNQPEAVKITRGPGKKHYPTWGIR